MMQPVNDDFVPYLGEIKNCQLQLTYLFILAHNGAIVID